MEAGVAAEEGCWRGEQGEGDWADDRAQAPCSEASDRASGQPESVLEKTDRVAVVVVVFFVGPLLFTLPLPRKRLDQLDRAVESFRTLSRCKSSRPADASHFIAAG